MEGYFFLLPNFLEFGAKGEEEFGQAFRDVANDVLVGFVKEFACNGLVAVDSFVVFDFRAGKGGF